MKAIRVVRRVLTFDITHGMTPSNYAVQLFLQGEEGARQSCEERQEAEPVAWQELMRRYQLHEK